MVLLVCSIQTLHYLKLLLSCNPQLADYISKILPPALNASAQYGRCIKPANNHCHQQQNTVNRDTDDNGYFFNSLRRLFCFWLIFTKSPS